MEIIQSNVAQLQKQEAVKYPNSMTEQYGHIDAMPGSADILATNNVVVMDPGIADNHDNTACLFS